MSDIHHPDEIDGATADEILMDIHRLNIRGFHDDMTSGTRNFIRRVVAKCQKEAPQQGDPL